MFDLLKNKLSGFVNSFSSALKAKKEAEAPKEEMGARPLEAKPSLTTALKAAVLPEVTVKEADVRSVLEDFELQLLTADVALPVIHDLVSDLKGRLVGRSVKSRELGAFVSDALRSAISDTIAQRPFDLPAFISGRPKPVKILFVGPNGAGKTTTIAKFAHFLKKNGLSSVLAASDTFRAAAIEQSVEHAQRVGIPVIKHQYGSDPAAVAFDAVRYAEARKIDVVLIDSAGRQETNRNLIEELRKIARVANPDLKLFVGEGIVGNAAISQVSQFNDAVKLDGIILTKVDCDAKGGTVISIFKATGIPILYLGTGQGYDDFIPFDPNFIMSRIFS